VSGGGSLIQLNKIPNAFSIASKFSVGVSVAVSAASLCINRRLYRIACIRVVTTTKADKRRAMLVDLAIGLGIPVLVMILRMFFSLYNFLVNFFLTGETLQTTLFKVIGLTFSKTLDAPIPIITHGPHIPSSSCRLYL
jgi:hypothetical protein